MALNEVALLNRVRRLEEQVALLSRQAGVAWEDSAAANVPESVVTLARSGKMIEAVQEYRKLTGCSLIEAKTAVESL